MPDSHALSEALVLRTANATAQIGVSGYGGIAFQISGTFSGTLTFEATVQGSEWVPFSVTEPDNTTRVTTTTSAGVFVGSVVGFTAVRVRMSSYSSGGASVIVRADLASPGSGGGGGGAGTDVNLVEVGGASIALGQTTMAASLPVTIASDQSAIPVTVTGGGGGGTASTFGAAFPGSGTAAGLSDPDGTMQPLSAETFDYDTGAGTVLETALGIAIPASGGPLPVLGGNGTAAQALRVTVASDSTGTTIATQSTATNLKTQAENYQGGAAVSAGNPLQVTLANSTGTQPVSGSLKWKAAGASGGTVLTTELNALANGAYSALGSEINNSTGLHTYGWLDVVLASLNPTTGAALTLFMCPAYDGTNYPDAPSATNPGAQFLVQTIYVATGSAAKRVGTATFRLPPFKVKFVLLNSTNVALGGTSNTVTLYTSEQGF